MRERAKIETSFWSKEQASFYDFIRSYNINAMSVLEHKLVDVLEIGFVIRFLLEP